MKNSVTLLIRTLDKSDLISIPPLVHFLRSLIYLSWLTRNVLVAPVGSPERCVAIYILQWVFVNCNFVMNFVVINSIFKKLCIQIMLVEIINQILPQNYSFIQHSESPLKTKSNVINLLRLKKTKTKKLSTKLAIIESKNTSITYKQKYKHPCIRWEQGFKRDSSRQNEKDVVLDVILK